MVSEVERQDVDTITRAHLAAERLEKANETMKELVRRQEAIESRRILAGTSSAGEPVVQEVSEDEKLKIGMKNYFKGGVLERVL
jgi:hypothetical protein